MLLDDLIVFSYFIINFDRVLIVVKTIKKSLAENYIFLSFFVLLGIF